MQRSRPVPDAGYTLIELLLVLSLVAVLAAVTVPSALRMFADTRLLDGAEQVRAQVGGTRVRAIDTGLVFQFRYEPDGRQYISVPFEPEAEPATKESGNTETSSSGSSTQGGGAPAGVGRLTHFAGTLPDGLRFVACCLPEGAVGGELSADVLGTLPNADDLSGISWSPPILFKADGSAIDAGFEVADDRGQSIHIEVRGLTGAATSYPIGREGSR